MDVSLIHDDYTESKAAWKMCRDAEFGQRKIRKGGEDYLPKLSGQSDDAYNSYLNRGLFYNATGRTISALLGLALRKPYTLELPTGMDDWKSNIDLAGTSFKGFVKKSFFETMVVGRMGVLVDHKNPIKQSSNVLTIEETRRQSLRPYLVIYKAEEILNWKLGTVNNVTMLVAVTLKETVEVDGENVEQRRVLTFDKDGNYIHEIYREKDSSWVLQDTIKPLKDGNPLNKIPFYFFGMEENPVEVGKLPVEDLANINIAHFRNSCDLENGAHVSGQPTPYVIGDVESSFQFELGQSGLMLPQGCEIGFLQCGSEGFATLEKAMDKKEQQMAAMGARMLAPEKSGVEAADTLSIRRIGEDSSLSSLAQVIETTIKSILEFMAEWAGLSGEVRFEMNKDYIPSQMSYQMLQALLQAVQSGEMSQETFFENLKNGEIIADDVSFEDEQERIANSAPPLGTINDDS